MLKHHFISLLLIITIRFTNYVLRYTFFEIYSRFLCCVFPENMKERNECHFRNEYKFIWMKIWEISGMGDTEGKGSQGAHVGSVEASILGGSVALGRLVEFGEPHGASWILEAAGAPVPKSGKAAQTVKDSFLALPSLEGQLLVGPAMLSVLLQICGVRSSRCWIPLIQLSLCPWLLVPVESDRWPPASCVVGTAVVGWGCQCSGPVCLCVLPRLSDGGQWTEVGSRESRHAVTEEGEERRA